MKQNRPLRFAALLIITFTMSALACAQGASDAALSAIRASDRNDRLAKDMSQVSSAEHLRRAGIYLTNRLFDEARAHWQAIINSNPNDVNVPAALFGMARSYYVERRYEEARQTYERLARDYPQTKEGREGLNFSASALLRMGRGAEAAARYAEYLEKYPNGERVDTAHLNIIDGYRESGRTQDAIVWIDRTRQRFAGTPTETGAIFARLRMDIATGDWPHAVQTADELLQRSLAGSSTSADEVLYLKGHSLDRAGRTQDAIRVFQMIPDNGFSYYGELATRRLRATGDAAANQSANTREALANSRIANVAADYPAPFSFQVVKEAKRSGVDPRFVLAIMRQESQFKSGARSPSAARGLLQLTIDAAKRYAGRAGVARVTEDSLYRPDVSIAIGSEYLAELSHMFAGLHEAMAAAYNGGEDNVARWLARSNQRDEGVFASEVGFTESKNYVFKVMTNYRVYRQLYDSKLSRR